MLHLDRYYHTSHFWIKCQDEQTAILGIDNLVLQLLFPIDRIIYPEFNTDYQRDQLVAIIVKNQHMFPLHIPLPGKVKEINYNFLNQQSNGNPGKDTFLFKIWHSEITKDKIFTGGKIGGFQTIRCKIELLAYYLKQLFRDNVSENIGVTLADGGIIENDLEKILGVDKYKSLLTDLQHR
jgi:glycine cleavage system H lipoate-binding protein